jgi:hypothetical protein
MIKPPVPPTFPFVFINPGNTLTDPFFSVPSNSKLSLTSLHNKTHKLERLDVRAESFLDLAKMKSSIPREIAFKFRSLIYLLHPFLTLNMKICK